MEAEALANLTMGGGRPRSSQATAGTGMAGGAPYQAQHRPFLSHRGRHHDRDDERCSSESANLVRARVLRGSLSPRDSAAGHALSFGVAAVPARQAAC